MTPLVVVFLRTNLNSTRLKDDVQPRGVTDTTTDLRRDSVGHSRMVIGAVSDLLERASARRCEARERGLARKGCQKH